MSDNRKSWIVFILFELICLANLADAQNPMRRRVSGAVTPSSSLNTGIVSFWKLDEASGNSDRVDAVGSNNLTASTGSLLRITGKVSYGLGALSAGDYVYHADNADLSLDGRSLTIAAWCSTSTDLYYPQFIRKGAAYTYTLIVDNSSSNKWSFWTSTNNGGAWDKVASDTAATQSKWFFVVVGYDSSQAKLFVSVNGEAKVFSTGTITIVDDAGSFKINPEGRPCLDAVGLWRRVLTNDEITELYNSGSGKEYPF